MLGITTIASFLFPVTHEDLMTPDHDLDYMEGDTVAFTLPNGFSYEGTVRDVCDVDLFGDVWLFVEYEISITRPWGEIKLVSRTWLTTGSVKLIEKNTAA